MEASSSDGFIPGSEPEPIPVHVSPMLAVPSKMPVRQIDYAFEYKWDGMRAVFFCDGRRWRLETRNLKDVTGGFPELAKLVESFTGRSAVLDGEVVAIGKENRPSFGLLQHRMGVVGEGAAARLAVEIPVTYMVFDVLYLDGSALMGLPYEERRRLLVAEGLSGASWQTPLSHVGEGDAMLDAARANRLEGIMAKRLDSPYRPGSRSREWLKVKLVERQEFVVGGWVPLSTGAGGVGALLLGYYDLAPSEAQSARRHQRLVYAGKVGTGFTDAERARLVELLGERRRQDSPFSEEEAEKGAVFAEPELVAEVEFRGWTNSSRLRQPSYKGLRTDKEAGEVVLEEER